jgi:hypothetical protein
MMIKFTALGEPFPVPSVPDGFRTSASSHAVERFIERIQPGMSAETARLLLQKMRPRIYRENGRRDGSWYLLYDFEPPFALVSMMKLIPDPKPPHACRQVFRALTCLSGHDHW